jgi:hypothetical protein
MKNGPDLTPGPFFGLIDRVSIFIGYILDKTKTLYVFGQTVSNQNLHIFRHLLFTSF